MHNFEAGKLYVFMAFDPWEPFFGTILSGGSAPEMMTAHWEDIEIGQLKLVHDWPVGEVYWYIVAPDAKILVELMCSADEFIDWVDIWEKSAEEQEGYHEEDKFKLACISMWDSQRW